MTDDRQALRAREAKAVTPRGPSQTTAVKLIDIRYKEKSSTYSYNRNVHADAELYFIDKGDVHVVIAKRIDFVLSQGEVCVFLPNQVHSAWAEKGNAPNIFDVHFQSKIEDFPLLSGRKFVLGDAERDLIRTLIRESAEKKVYHKEIMESLLGCLLLCLLRRVRERRDSGEKVSALRYNLRNLLVDQTKLYVCEHLREPLSLSSIANALCVSPSHLSHTFKKVEDCGVIEYITAARIAKAKDLLRRSSLSVTEIAGEAGFSSIHYFSRVFKVKTGYSPSQYTRSLR